MISLSKQHKVFNRISVQVNNIYKIQKSYYSIQSTGKSLIDNVKKISKELNNQVSCGINDFNDDIYYTKHHLKLMDTNDLNRSNKMDLLRHKKDVYYFIPLFVYLLIPFSTFGLPIYIKYFPQFLPSTFSSRIMIKKNNVISFESRLRSLQKLFISLNLQQVNGSAPPLVDLKVSNINNNDTTINIYDFKWQQLKLLSDSLGYSLNFLLTKEMLLNRIKHYIKTTVEDDRLIQIENQFNNNKEYDENNLDIFKNLTIEDLQDICFKRGIEYRDLDYQQLSNTLKNYFQIFLKFSNINLESQKEVTDYILTLLFYQMSLVK